MQEKWLHYESSNHDRHFKFRNCYACSSRYSHQFIADAQAGYSFDDRSHFFFLSPGPTWWKIGKEMTMPVCTRGSVCPRYFAKGKIDWEIDLGVKFLTRPQHFAQARLPAIIQNATSGLAVYLQDSILRNSTGSTPASRPPWALARGRRRNHSEQGSELEPLIRCQYPDVTFQTCSKVHHSWPWWTFN